MVDNDLFHTLLSGEGTQLICPILGFSRQVPLLRRGSLGKHIEVLGLDCKQLRREVKTEKV